MKKTTIGPLLVIVLFAGIYLSAKGYIDWITMGEDRQFFYNLEDKMSNKNQSFKLKEVTYFDWTHVCYFGPYSNPYDLIKKELGIEVMGIQQQDFLDDGVFSLYFLKNDRLVNKINLPAFGNHFKNNLMFFYALKQGTFCVKKDDAEMLPYKDSFQLINKQEKEK